MTTDQGIATHTQQLPPVLEAGPNAVMRWIALGWRDIWATGWPSLLHGLIVTIASLAIVQVTLQFWPLLPGAVTGFLVMGPMLATGLYALSRSHEQGRQTRAKDACCAWRDSSRCLLGFGVVLVLIGTLWVGLSVFMFHYFVDADVSKPLDFLRYVILQGNDTFMAWTLLAGLVSSLVFAGTVVSVPLLMDRDVTMKEAIFTSLRAVGENPITMLWWAMFLLFATGLSVATGMLGFLILYPLMGHASWHVYRELVDASGLPARHCKD